VRKQRDGLGLQVVLALLVKVLARGFRDARLYALRQRERLEWVGRRHWSNSTERPLLSVLRSCGREGRVSAVEPPLIGSGRATGYGQLRTVEVSAPKRPFEHALDPRQQPRHGLRNAVGRRDQRLEFGAAGGGEGGDCRGKIDGHSPFFAPVPYNERVARRLSPRAVSLVPEFSPLPGSCHHAFALDQRTSDFTGA